MSNTTTTTTIPYMILDLEFCKISLGIAIITTTFMSIFTGNFIGRVWRRFMIGHNRRRNGGAGGQVSGQGQGREGGGGGFIVKLVWVALSGILYMITTTIRNFNPACSQWSGFLSAFFNLLTNLLFIFAMSEKEKVYKILSKGYGGGVDTRGSWNVRWRRMEVWKVYMGICWILLGDYLLSSLFTYNGVGELKVFAGLSNYSVPAWYIILVTTECVVNTLFLKEIVKFSTNSDINFSNKPEIPNSTPAKKSKGVVIIRKRLGFTTNYEDLISLFTVPLFKKPLRDLLWKGKEPLPLEVKDLSLIDDSYLSYIHALRFVVACYLLDFSFCMLMIYSVTQPSSTPNRAVITMSCNYIVLSGLLLHIMNACGFVGVVSKIAMRKSNVSGSDNAGGGGGAGPSSHPREKVSQVMEEGEGEEGAPPPIEWRSSEARKGGISKVPSSAVASVTNFRNGGSESQGLD